MQQSPFELFNKAAQQNFTPSFNYLGRAYFNGEGIEKSYTNSFTWFDKSAKLNDPEGQLNLGVLYLGGFGVQEDVQKAKEYLKKASDQGIKRATNILSNIKLRPTYVYAQTFRDGVAGIMKVGKGANSYSYIDKKGNELFHDFHEQKYPVEFREGLAPFTEGNEVIGYKVGYIDKQGKIIIKAKYDKGGLFVDGFSVVKVGNKYGLIDKDDKEIIPPIYSALEYAREDLMSFRKGAFSGFINKLGVEVIPANYIATENFSEGIAAVLNTLGRLDYIDKNGQRLFGVSIFTNDDNRLRKFNEGLINISNVDKKKGYLDSKGNVIIDYKFDDSTPFFKGYALVRIGDFWGVIDKNGSFIVQPKYEELKFFSDSTNVKFLFKTNNKWGALDNLGREIFPAKYDSEIYYTNFAFVEGMLKIKSNKKYGFIDMAGKEIIPPIYDGAKDFSEGLAAVEIDGRWGYIDKNGNKVLGWGEQYIPPQK